MFVCRRVHPDHPETVLDSRRLVEGSTTLGRDAACDWRLDASDDALSRVHCTLSVEGGRLWLRDHSTNGVRLDDGERAPHEQAVEIAPGTRLRLGGSIIVCERSVDALAEPAGNTASPDESLLDAFCAGAKLDASAFAGEDPAELMRRVGGIYRETVLGLAALMHDRARFKTARGLDRTTIGAGDNNPFKWAATRRLAQDLLGGGESGFLADAQAVQASFADLGRYIEALHQGSQAAARHCAERLSPASIEAEARGQGALLRGRAAVCWDVHNRRHRDLVGEDVSGGGVDQVFADAYRSADTGA